MCIWAHGFPFHTTTSYTQTVFKYVKNTEISNNQPVKSDVPVWIRWLHCFLNLKTWTRFSGSPETFVNRLAAAGVVIRQLQTLRHCTMHNMCRSTLRLPDKLSSLLSTEEALLWQPKATVRHVFLNTWNTWLYIVQLSLVSLTLYGLQE